MLDTFASLRNHDFLADHRRPNRTVDVPKPRGVPATTADGVIGKVCRSLYNRFPKQPRHQEDLPPSGVECYCLGKEFVAYTISRASLKGELFTCSMAETPRNRDEQTWQRRWFKPMIISGVPAGIVRQAHTAGEQLYRGLSCSRGKSTGDRQGVVDIIFREDRETCSDRLPDM